MGSPIPRHLKIGHAQSVDVFGQPHLFLATSAETGGAYSVLEAVTPPGVGPPPHIHSREDEFFYILHGEYEFTVGDSVIRAAEGDSLFAPRNVPHTFRNMSSSASRLLVIISPGGLERFFEEVGKLPAGPPDPEALGTLLAQYGLQFAEC